MAATTYTWKNITDSWGTASNWTPGTGPPGEDGSTTDVVRIISASGGSSYTVSLSGTTVTIGGFSMASSPGGPSTATSPTLQLSNATIDDTGAFRLNVTSNGHPVVEGTGTLEWGTLTSNNAGQAPVIEASGGTLTLDGSITSAAFSMNFDVAASSVLDVNGAVTDTALFYFLGNTGELQFTSAAISGTPSNPGMSVDLSGMNVGTSASVPTNFIDVAGTPSNVSLSGTSGTSNTLTITESGNVLSFALSGITFTSGNNSETYYVRTQGDGAGGTEVFLSDVVCYAAGTRLMTATGEVAVEDLAAADLMVTLDGEARSLQPVTWIGYRKVDLAAHSRPELVAPVRIRRHAFGADMPRRDLLLSPDHAIYVDGKLVVARLLLNGMTITQEFASPTVEYYHVELPRHAVLLAEGLPAESYLDTGNRAMFANAGLALVLHPDFGVSHGIRTWEDDACAPLATAPAEIEPIWRTLAERAEALGYAAPRHALSADPDLHLLVDGRRVQPITVTNGRHLFQLPRRAASIRLVSRASAPTDFAPYREDRRRLGVAVGRLVLRLGAELREIPVDHPALVHGWHRVEREGREIRRWTDGDAHLPIAFEGTLGLAMLEVHTTCANTYRLDEPAAEQRLVA